MNKPLILVVEDDPSVKNLITTTLKAHDYRFLSTANGQGAIMDASSHNPDIILLDLGLPDMDGESVPGPMFQLLSSAPGARIQTKSMHWTLEPMIT